MKKENPNTDFVALEKQILKYWEDNKCFEKLMEKKKIKMVPGSDSLTVPLPQTIPWAYITHGEEP